MSETQRNKIIKDIEEKTSLKVINIGDASGGCIADSFFVDLSDGERCFVKFGVNFTHFLNCETNGLRELAKAGVKVPKIKYLGDGFILMEYIEEGCISQRFFHLFGRSLAKMHKHKSDNYGFYEDNYIGKTPQINSYNSSWLEFYFINRLLYQYKLAEKNGCADKLMHEYFVRLEKKLPGIIEGSEEFPCLLHGDLWSGNYICNNKGEVVLIDPAVYYGHREAELAMTKLFGGFSDDFYASYNDEWPLIEDYAYRERIYLLYHLLNHLNMFGEGYYVQVMNTMKFYL